MNEQEMKNAWEKLGGTVKKVEETMNEEKFVVEQLETELKRIVFQYRDRGVDVETIVSRMEKVEEWIKKHLSNKKEVGNDEISED